jgi:hypothetical protein
LVGGTLSNVSVINLEVQPFDASQANLNPGGSTASFISVVPTSAPLASQRSSFVWNAAVTSGTLAFIRPSIAPVIVASGVPINFTLRIGGVQLELGVMASSYIPTTGAAVTRAQDLAAIPPANMGFFVSTGGSWMAEFIPKNYQVGGTYQRVVLFPPVPGGAGPIMTNVGFGVQYDGSTIQQSANAVPVNTVQKMASTWGASQGQLCLNAGPVVSNAMSVGYAGAVANGVALMLATGSGVQNTPGWLRRLRYWPRVLSPSELQSITR